MISKVFCAAILFLLLPACHKKPSPTVLVDPALAMLVSPDTVLLAGIRMEPLRSTPLYQRLITGRTPARLEGFIRDTGLDPRKDIWEFLIAHNGKDAVVMARGKFAEMGLEPRLNREGAVRMQYKGYTLLGDAKNAVAFMNSSTAVAGPSSAVRSIIDMRNAAQGGIPAVFAEKIKSISSANQLWVAGNIHGRLPMLDFRGSGNLANLNNILPAIKTFDTAIDLRTGCKAHANAVFDSEQDAKRVKETLRGLIGFARLNTPENRLERLRVFDGIKVEYSQNVLTVDADLPVDLLDEMMKLENYLR
ncbi:MAG TPA: hypothetical protein VMZ52_06020 [Bryobacteraceae bacterium]|nr:hypothetical protein [Bryobacteraceae bacterium]